MIFSEMMKEKAFSEKMLSVINNAIDLIKNDLSEKDIQYLLINDCTTLVSQYCPYVQLSNIQLSSSDLSDFNKELEQFFIDKIREVVSNE